MDPQSGFQQPGLMYPQYSGGLTGHDLNIYNEMAIDTQLWNQPQPQQQPAYLPNQWPAPSHGNPPPAFYAQPGATPQYHGQQSQPMNYQLQPQGLHNFDVPQVQSNAGPARVARRQNAQEKVIQADPTRKSGASRNERSRGKRGDASSSRSAPQSKESSSRPSEVPTTAAQVTAPAQQSTSSAQSGQAPSVPGPSLEVTPTTAGDSSSAQDAASDDAAKKKSRLTNLDRRDICVYQRDTPGVRQEDIAKKWGVERSTVSKILKEKNKWLSIAADETVEIAKARPPKFEQIEEKLTEWLMTKVEVGSSVSDKEIHDKALEFSEGSNVAMARFKASPGWVDGFKNRVGIRKGIWLGFGTNNEKNRALGNESGNLPDPLESLGPTMMDNLYREGLWDPTAAARDLVYEVPVWKTPIRQILEKHGGRPWHMLTKEEQEASEAAGDNDLWPHYEMMKQERELEDNAVKEAQREALAAEAAAIAAGQPFDFRATFDALVREKLAAVDYETIDVPELDVPPVPGQHPDDIEPTPGPSGERAQEAIWEVIRFCMPRRGRVFSNAHCAVLLEIWARVMIVHERQRRAGERRDTYEHVYNKDRANDKQHSAEMIAERERDFALNPTGESTGRDVVARQIRKEELEHLKEMQTAHAELVSDPKAAAWLDQVHNAQREEAPSVDDEAPAASALPPPQSESQPLASSSGHIPSFLDDPELVRLYRVHQRDDTLESLQPDPPLPLRDEDEPDFVDGLAAYSPRIDCLNEPYRELTPELPFMNAPPDSEITWTGSFEPSLQQGDPNPPWTGSFDTATHQDGLHDVVMAGLPMS